MKQNKHLPEQPIEKKKRPRINTVESINAHYLKSLFEHRTDPSTLMIIGREQDAIIIEKTELYKGHYYVLEAILPPSEGRSPQKLILDPLIEKIEKGNFKEIIFALGYHPQVTTTEYFLYQKLKRFKVRFSKIENIPINSYLSNRVKEAIADREPYQAIL